MKLFSSQATPSSASLAEIDGPLQRFSLFSLSPSMAKIAWVAFQAFSSDPIFDPCRAAPVSDGIADSGFEIFLLECFLYCRQNSPASESIPLASKILAASRRVNAAPVD